MKVPLLDLKPQYQQIKEKVLPEVMEIIESQGFILGPKVEKLEKEMAAYLGAQYTLGCSSGTDALLLALMALDIGKDDEVITTPYTFFATAGSIARVGATARFVDIDPATFLMRVDQIENAITPKTKAIMPVHLFGQCVDMEPLMNIARKHKLAVIEDAAQAIGSKYQGKDAGTFGDTGCFSFFPSKNLGCFGDGGLVSTNRQALHERLKGLRVHGGQVQYQHLEVGLNARIDALQAAVVSVKLPFLAGWTEGRRKNAALYNELFKGNPKVVTPIEKPDCFHIYNQYVIRVNNRDALKAHLAEKEIGCSVYYPLSLHQQKCFANLGYKKGDFPESEKAADTSLALPIFPELNREQIEFVAKTINEFTA
ncbi:MAG: DegT/DnrJ/EryC1/StrS family aminotransferase [Candidatus Riflebacteria bacterium]|jgi:dTDP-4-amino-4,6-dideoxygalactose transaminase|nr:DegT/DnrJ/EryC1/StrS family aminotransferase [Candidatus Riflebacteria bacterium]